jgi:hypothetical protein
LEGDGGRVAEMLGSGGLKMLGGEGI